MTKIFTIGLLAIGAMSVTQTSTAQTTNEVVKRPTAIYTGVNKIPVSKSFYTPHAKNRSGNTSVKIGTTYYDLQTNNSMSRRIINYGNDKISATWTMSQTADPATGSFADRGTGYNYKNGTSWGALPTARLENIRTGFTNLNNTGSKEIVVSHSSANRSMYTFGNASTGSSTFTQTSVAQPAVGDTALWAKVANVGNTVYMISSNSSQPDTNNIGFHFSKSTDGGATWAVNMVSLPILTKSDIWRVSGDAYNIAAMGDTVAIVVGDVLTNLYMLKSKDGGVTWTKDTVLDCLLPANRNPFNVGTRIKNPAPGGDTVRTIFSTDGSASVSFNKIGQVCIVYSPAGGRVTDSLAAAAPGSYFPSTFINTMNFWREDFGSNSFIKLDSLFDCNGTADFDFGVNHFKSGATAGGAVYGANGSSNFSQMAISGDSIYVVYSAVMDADTTDGSLTNMLTGLNYRDIFVIASTDGGNTWGKRVDLSNSPGMEEVFPSVASLVDGNLHIIWHQDTEPGTVLTNGDAQNDPISVNYLKVPVSYIFTHSDAADLICQNTAFGPSAVSNLVKSNINFVLSPNPTTNTLKVSGEIDNTTISIVNMMGETVYAPVTVKGTEKNIDVNAFANGIYFLKISNANGSTTERFTKN